MVYVWTGLTQAIGMRYYGIPGIDVPPDVGFQYLEPGEGGAFMKADEYDELIADPTAFLYNVWLPRVSSEVVPPGEASSYRGNLALVKGAMAMMQYFGAFGTQNDRLRNESGTVSAIAGIFKAPLDILADKLRGYVGLSMDMCEQPDKVLEACEALMPHLYHVAKTTADPLQQVPIGYWMHRGCVPFVSPEQFDSHYWPTVRPIIEELWRHGHQTLFYAEGDWKHHLESFRELPDRSIVYHVDQADVFDVHESSGGPHTLKYGTTTNHVLALELVLPDAECVQIGSPTGWAPGYDLVGAVVGSEGTLGVVTAATLRLVPIPERVETLLGIFPDVVRACRAVGGIIEAGMVPAALEMLDRRTVAAVEASVYAAGLPTDAGAVLIVELDGPAVSTSARGREACSSSPRATRSERRVEVARDDEERQRFWRARKGAFGAMGRLAPDLYVHDAVVPRSATCPRCSSAICEIGDRYRSHPVQRLPRWRRQSAPEHLLRPPRSRRAAARARRRIRNPRAVREGGRRHQRRARHRRRQARFHGSDIQRG